MRNKLLFSLSLVLALSMLLALPFSAAAGGKPPTVDVQILALNDFHGALDPSRATVSGTGGNPNTYYMYGGAEFLSARLKAATEANPNTIKVSAGDMIGASPLLSAAFHDEPTILAFNLMGFEFSAVGNHEFDEGWTELLRMQNGGCHPVDGCKPGTTFAGASFKYLTANVIRLDNGQLLFPAVGVKTIGGVKVGFIGVSLESTPTIVVPSSVTGLQFTAEVEAINKYVKILKDTEDIKSIVVLLHDGASAVNPPPNSCNLTDPFITNIVMKIDPEVDVLITGHSHNAYNCSVTIKKNYGPMLVTAAGNNGRYYTDIDLTINGTNDQVASAVATNVEVVDGPTVTSTTPPTTAPKDPDMTALLAPYRTAITPIANAVIGYISAPLTRTGSAAGESTLGDVIADAQLEFTTPAANGGAVIAMTNPGGIRVDLVGTGSTSPYTVTYGQAFAVQPFSNLMVAMDLTGKQLKDVLEQQFVGCGQPVNGQKILQVSATFKYSWSATAACGSKISNMQLNGTPMDMATTYRVTVNNFLAGGGDNFTKLTAGTNLYTSGVDLDAFVAYLTNHSTQATPLQPPTLNRITVLP